MRINNLCGCLVGVLALGSWATSSLRTELACWPSVRRTSVPGTTRWTRCSPRWPSAPSTSTEHQAPSRGTMDSASCLLTSSMKRSTSSSGSGMCYRTFLSALVHQLHFFVTPRSVPSFTQLLPNLLFKFLTCFLFSSFRSPLANFFKNMKVGGSYTQSLGHVIMCLSTGSSLWLWCLVWVCCTASPPSRQPSARFCSGPARGSPPPTTWRPFPASARSVTGSCSTS